MRTEQGHEEVGMSRADLASRAFWTDHPLCRMYAIARGSWAGNRFEPATSWSFRELREFAEELPERTFLVLAGGSQCQ